MDKIQSQLIRLRISGGDSRFMKNANVRWFVLSEPIGLSQSQCFFWVMQ